MHKEGEHFREITYPETNTKDRKTGEYWIYVTIERSSFWRIAHWDDESKKWTLTYELCVGQKHTDEELRKKYGDVKPQYITEPTNNIIRRHDHANTTEVQNRS